MTGGFSAHGKHSVTDFGACYASRNTGVPSKKSVTATVPYMSGFYDLSDLYGGVAYENREVTYSFDLLEDTPEELQAAKSELLAWLSQINDEHISDDDMSGRHFIGSFDSASFDEGDEGLSGTLEVTFLCQPFLEDDEATTQTLTEGSNTVTVSGQPVNAYAVCAEGSATLTFSGSAQAVTTTQIRVSPQLKSGENTVTVSGSPVTLSWYELSM